MKNSTLRRTSSVFVFVILFHSSFAIVSSNREMNKKNIADNFLYDDALTIEIMDDCSETAFAFLNVDEDSTTVDVESMCFIPQFNRWGWTTYLDISETTGQNSYTLDVYAGAGQCNLSNGTDVGNVSIFYNANSTLTIEYDLEGYVLTEAHIYIGEEPFPIGNNGTETVAPGQYTFSDSDFGEVQNYTVSLPVNSEQFYIIIHGVTKENGCSIGNCEDSDNDNVCDTDDICPGFDDNIDSDGDGIPDGCDTVECEDSDNDEVCDTDDICPGFDDNLDSDGDGIPDGCDNGAFEAYSFKAYPIPYNKEINIQFAYNYDTFIIIEIFDTKGVKLSQITINNYIKGTLSTSKVDLDNFNKQLLFIRLTTAKSQQTKKIISNDTKYNHD